MNDQITHKPSTPSAARAATDTDTRRTARRGSISAAALVVLVVTAVLVVGSTRTGRTEHDLTVSRMETMRAFYAAESAVQLALREITLGVDVDGDGVIGGISDDDDHTNNPSIGQARIHVTAEQQDAGVVVLTATATEGRATRRIRVEIEPN